MLFITFVMYSRQKPFQQVVPTDILFKIEILVRFLPIAFGLDNTFLGFSMKQI